MRLTHYAGLGILAFAALFGSARQAAGQWSIAVGGFSAGSAETEHYQISLQSPDIRHRRSAAGWPFSGDTVELHFALQASATHFYLLRPFNGLQLTLAGTYHPISWTVFGDSIQLLMRGGVGGYSANRVWIFGEVISLGVGLEVGRGFACEATFDSPLGLYTESMPPLFEVGVRRALEF
jgi:hypothetical protein